MYYVIANPIAGRGQCQNVLPLIQDFFAQQSEPYQMVLTEYEGHASILARQALALGADKIISAGGDGTFFEILNGVYQDDVVLGILPCGTGNDFCRTLGISTHIDTALTQFKQTEIKQIDIGVERDAAFASICAIGFVADVIDHVNTHRYRWIKGSMAFGMSVYQTIRKLKAFPITIKIDNQTYQRKVVLAAILNAPYVGGGMQFAPSADPTDGLLELFLVNELGRFELLKVFPSVYKGTHLNHPSVEILQGRNITLHTETPLIKQFDGNIIGHSPVELQIAPQKIKILVPKIL